MIAVHPDQARLDFDAPATRGASRRRDPHTAVLLVFEVTEAGRAAA